MTAPTSPSPDSLAEVVAADQTTADPIEQMLKVCSVSREHDLLISRTWVLAWAELWQAERAGRERLDAEMRKGITREDTDVVMPFDLYLKMTDADTKLTAENEMLRAKLAACETRIDGQLISDAYMTALEEAGMRPELRATVYRHAMSIFAKLSNAALASRAAGAEEGK